MNRLVETLAYLGPAGTFTELACKQVLEWPAYKEVLSMDCDSITRVCALVADGVATYGVVPVENSTAGDVKDTALALTNLELQIRGELILPISHSLYRLPKARIQRIVTKDQAYYQCEQNLRRLYPEHEFNPVNSTALAVQMAAENPTIGAIGSRNAAEALGIADKLEREDGMEDNKSNVTTFVIISKPGEVTPITNNDKTTLILSLRNQSGSLYRYLKELQEWRINLNKIRSLGQTNNDTLFLVSIDGHIAEDSVGRAVRFNPSIEARLPKMLGSYRRADYYLPIMDGIPPIDHVVKQIKTDMKIDTSPTSPETVVVFTLDDRIGALAGALRPFAEEGINLVRINSLPTRRSMGEYAFYLSCDRDAPGKNSAITELSKYATQVVLLNHISLTNNP